MKSKNQFKKIMWAIKSSIRDEGYRFFFFRLWMILVNTLRSPNLMIFLVRSLISNKKAQISNIRYFVKLNLPAYSSFLSFSDRVNIFNYHNRFVNSNLVGAENIKLWSSSSKNNTEIYLMETQDFLSQEGMLTLAFFLEGKAVFFFSFVICDGQIFSHFGPILFLTRIQGAPGQYASIKLINKLLGNLNLSNALLSAAEGLALSLGIRKIISVSACTQVSFKSDGSKMNFYSTYDQFLLKNSALLEKNQHFLLPVPFVSKECGSCRTHRARHKKHLAIRSEISQSVMEVMNREFYR